MSEKPIILTTREVQGVLAGRKTMKRIVIKPNIVDRFTLDSNGKLLGSFTEDEGDIYPTIDDCQYQIGDILWVRETWYTPCNKNDCSEYEGCQEGCSALDDFYYKADKNPLGWRREPKWRPSIHMPCSAARLFLKVTNVRVERLQDITEDDAKAEGIVSYWAEPHRDDAPFIGSAKGIGDDLCLTRREAFQQLWNSLNAKRGYGWDVNPWVWIVEFERITL